MATHWFCKKCGGDFGTTGMAPWDPSTKTGTLTTSCKSCHKIFASKFEHGVIQLKGSCYTKSCAGPVEVQWAGQCILFSLLLTMSRYWMAIALNAEVQMACF